MSPCRTNHQTSSFGSPGASIRYAIGGCYRLPTNAFQLVAALHTTGENKAEDCVCIGRAPVLVSFALTSPIGISRTPHAAALLHANHTHLPYSVSAAPGQCRSSADACVTADGGSTFAANLLSVKYCAIRHSYLWRICDHVHGLLGVYLRISSKRPSCYVPSPDSDGR
jgi:hypothetical protein